VLDDLLTTFGKSRQSEISERIPNDPTIMSGEFGELLLYYVLPEAYCQGSNVFNPPKWKWKFDKNKALQYTDIVILNQFDSKNPSTNDYIIAVEAKARATKPGKEDVLAP
jgi:hypothetical protein